MYADGDAKIPDVTVSPGRWRSVRSPGAIAIALGLILAFGLVAAGIAAQRRVGNYLKETDFYHLYAPDADRVLAGIAPRHTNNTGPGYPSSRRSCTRSPATTSRPGKRSRSSRRSRQP
jgi:hypothetical protein